MSTLSELIIKIGADSSGLHNELSKTKQDVHNAFSDVSPINNMTNALTGTTGAVEALAGKFTKLAGIAAGGFGLTSLISSAVDAGENVYQLSQRLGIAASEASMLNRIMKQTGGDVDTAAKSVMRLDQTLSSGGKSGETTAKWLQVFGVSLKDAEGNLLPLNKQLEALSEGYIKAQKAGHAQEFLMNTLGTRGLALTKTLQQYAEAKENASKVQSIGLDVNRMHELDQQMKVLNMQFGQIKLIAGEALAPIAADILPKIANEMAYVSKLVKEHKEGIYDVTRGLVTVLAIYKSVQAARNIATRVHTAVSSLTQTAQVEAQEEALTKAQERAIARRERAIERAALKEQQAYAKSVRDMEISEEEKSRLVAEHTARRTAMAEEEAARERAIMTEMFQQVNAERKLAEAQAAESYAATATAAQAASEKIIQANTEAAASSREIVAGNEAVVASEAEVGTTAELASARKVEASAAVKVAVAEEVTANETLAVAEAETGTAAQVAGTQKVTAETASKVAVGETTLAQNAQKAAVVETGVAATVTGGKMTAMAVGAVGSVKTLTSAVWALAGGWLGVGAAIAYCLSQFMAKKMAERKADTFTADDGTIYHWYKDEGKWTKEVDTQYSEDAEATNNTTMMYGNGGLNGYGRQEVEVTDPDELDKANDMWNFGDANGNGGHIYDEDYQAKLAADEAEKAAQARQDDINALLANMTATGVDVGGSGGPGAGTSASSSAPKAESVKVEVPQETVYSLLANGSAYAPYANEIKYVANNWGYSPNLLAALLMQENTSANPYAVSSDNAHFGLGQISRDIANQYSNGDYNDPNQNILAAGSYLGDLITQFDGDIRLAIAAYNAGPGGARGNADSAYTNSVLDRYNSATTWTQDARGNVVANQAPQYADVPVGQVAAKVAGDQTRYVEGSQWMGDVTSDASIQCDSFTANVYNVAGISEIGGHSTSGVINDQAFRDAGAYHDVNSGYTPQAGDLVDSAHHVGMYLGNGMVRSRDSSGGITTRSLEAWDSQFGITGYGSISEATGGQTVRQQVDASGKAAQDAYNKYQQNLQKLNQLTQSMATTVLTDGMTDAQKDRAKVLDDIAKKQLQINELKKNGLDVSNAEKMLDIYKDYQLEEIEKKYQKLYQTQVDSAAKADAAARYDYVALANAEYEETVHKLDEERKKKEQELMRDKNDWKTRQVISEEYYANLHEAQEKRDRAIEESAEKEIQHLTELADLSKLINSLADNTPLSTRRQEAMAKNGQRNLAKEYVKIWETAHGQMSDYIVDVSESIYSSLSDSMAEFIRGTRSAKSVFQDFGNAVIQTMAKIAAQRLAASWMENIFGWFGGGRSSYNAGLLSANGIGGTSFLTGKYSFTNEALGLKTFASGGIVTAPTLGLIGESGEHEAVIPLNNENLRAIGGNKGGGVVVNITNKTDSNVKVENSSYDEDMSKWVLDVVVDGATRNKGGFGSNLKTALGAR